MSHSLIIGITGSGKTTLAKNIARTMKEKGKGVLVLDPLFDPGWICDYKTHNPKEFLRVCEASTNCYVFVDESGQAIGRYNPEMEWLATQGRHHGHNSVFIAQRAQQVSKTLRDQCEKMFIFRVSFNDAKLLVEEFADKRLMKACELGRFEYIQAERFREPVIIKCKKF